MTTKLQVEQYVSPPVQTNAWLVFDPESRQALIIDPGEGTAADIRDSLQDKQAGARAIVLTHGHIDHIGDVAALAQALHCPVHAHPDCDHMASDPVLSGAVMLGFSLRAFDVDEHLGQGDTIELGAHRFSAIDTPGHCPGSICLLGAGLCFTGDLLFENAVGRWDLPGGDRDTLIGSIRRLDEACHDDTIIHPGHGPATTMGRERRNNPYLLDWLV